MSSAAFQVGLHGLPRCGTGLKVARLGLVLLPLILGGGLWAKAMLSTTFSKQLWLQLGLGSQADVWPPAGTFLPRHPAAIPGSSIPGGSVSQSVSRLAMFNTTGGLFQVALGTPSTQITSLANLSQYITLAPGRTLPTRMGVWALAPWGNGGLAAGTRNLNTGAGAVEVWPSKAALEAGGHALWQLQAPGGVNALLSLETGGIIAGTLSAGGALKIWPNATAVQEQHPPLALLRGQGVCSLLSLPSGVIAAGTGRADGTGALLLWLSVEQLLEEAEANLTLQAPGWVWALVALPGGGLAAGTDAGTVEVWLNAAAVHSGRRTAQLILSGTVTGLLPLPGGGLAAAASTQRAGGFLAVWPNASSVLHGGPPVLSVRTHAADSLLQLDNGVIAVGTAGSVDLWSGPLKLLRGEPPTVSLQAPWQNNALLPLPGGGLIGGGLSSSDPNGGPGTVSLWPSLLPLLEHLPESKLRASLYVSALIPLASGGIAVGTQNLITQHGGDVDVWRHLGAKRVSLPASGPVGAIVELRGGGLAAGTIIGSRTSGVDIWANATALQAGLRPSFSLPASGAVLALLLLSEGGLAAGTASPQGVGRVDLWMDLEGFRGGERPTASLMPSGVVQALLELPGGGIAAGTCSATALGCLGPGTLDIWPNASCLRNGAHPVLSLPASSTEGVTALALLPSGNIVAGLRNGDTGALLVWPALASLQPDLHPLRIPVSSQVSGLAVLSGGGIAAALASARTMLGAVGLWPDEQSLLLGQPPVVQLQTSDQITSLAALPGGGLAAGTSSSDVELWLSTALNSPAVPAPAGGVYVAAELRAGIALGTVTSQGPSVELWRTISPGSYVRDAILDVASAPTSILELSSGQLIVGTINGTIYVCTSSENCATLVLGGRVRAFAGGVGLVAAVERADSSGSLALWPSFKELAAGGLPQVLNLSSTPTALHWLGDSLLVGTTHTLEVWKPSNGQLQVLSNLSGAVSSFRTLPGDGLAMATDDYQVQIWLSSQCLERGQPSDLNLTTPALGASLAILDDGTLVAGGAAFVPVTCPSGTFSLGGRLLNCTACPPGWLSEPGASSCSFANNQQVLDTSMTFAACLATGVVAALSWKCLFPRLAAGPWTLDFAKKGLLVAALALLAMARVEDCSAATLTWLLVCLTLGCFFLLWDSHTEGRYMALILLIVALTSTLQVLFAPQGVAVLTAVGRLLPVPSPAWWRVQVLLAGSIGCAGLSYAVPTIQLLSRDRERPSLDVELEVLSSEARRALEMASQLWSAGEADDAPDSCCRGGVRRLSSLREPLGRITRTFTMGHSVPFALGLLTAVQMGWQFHNASVSNVSRGLILLSVVVGLLQCAVSALAILITWCGVPKLLPNLAVALVDRHFRVAIALKYAALALKLLVLVLPFQRPLTNVYLGWQCETPALCPSECTSGFNGTNQSNGTCSTAKLPSSDEVHCTCIAFERAELSIVYNCGFSIAVSVGLSVLSVKKYMKLESFIKNPDIQRPRTKLLAQPILVLVPAAVHLCYLWLICQAQASCLTLADVAIIIYPNLFLSLMANEVKRSLAAWREETSVLFSTLWSDDLLLKLQPFGVVFAVLGSVAAAARAKSIGPLWPTTSIDCSSTLLPWTLISLFLAAGAIAAAMAGPVAKQHTTSDAAAAAEADAEMEAASCEEAVPGRTG